MTPGNPTSKKGSSPTERLLYRVRAARDRGEISDSLCTDIVNALETYSPVETKTHSCDDGMREIECPHCHGVGGGIGKDGVEIECSLCDGHGGVLIVKRKSAQETSTHRGDLPKSRNPYLPTVEHDPACRKETGGACNCANRRGMTQAEFDATVNGRT